MAKNQFLNLVLQKIIILKNKKKINLNFFFKKKAIEIKKKINNVKKINTKSNLRNFYSQKTKLVILPQ